MEDKTAVTRRGPNNRLERSRGRHFRCAKEGVDDWDKSASFAGGATPRSSTSSLDDTSAVHNDLWQTVSLVDLVGDLPHSTDGARRSPLTIGSGV